jgi:hypothetical protein
MKPIIDLPFLDVTFPRKVSRFLYDDPQTELPKREVVDFVPGKQRIEALRTLKEMS